MLKIVDIRTEYVKNPIGITNSPRFSWKFISSNKNSFQLSYEIQIAAKPDFSEIVFQKKEGTGRSLHHIFPDFEMKSFQKYYWRVRITDNHGEESEFSEPATFITAFIDSNEWRSDFITCESEQDISSSKGTCLRKEFHLHKAIDYAYICCTALGLYQLYINEKRVGDDELTPGWTSYHKHLLYQMYDITEYLTGTESAQSINVLLGAGYYKGKMGFLGLRNNYGDRTAFLCQLKIKYQDGTEETIETDESWQGTDSPILFSEIYDGEIYDARKTSGPWKETTVIPFDKTVLKSQFACKPKEMIKVPAREIITSPKGEKIVDFGQNMAGWVHFTVRNAAPGDRVELQFFEVLDDKGNVYTDNLRSAKQRIMYICKGGEIEEFHPHFTYQGFRYAEVVSYPGAIGLQDICAYAVYSDMELTGTFSCSNRELNQLWSNITWGLRSNFVDIPTDCPQRNERAGWTGDAQIFCRTASYIMNTYLFFEKWLIDVKMDQTDEGGVPHVVPDFVTPYIDKVDDWLLSQGTHSAAAWADVAVLGPWNLYLTFGDQKILIDQYESMKAWIHFMETHAVDGIWNYKLQFGDWVALDAQEGSYYGATPNDLTCTAYYAYSTGIFAKIAKILNNMEDATYYSNLEKEIKRGFVKRFFNPETKGMTVQTQTAHILALHFNLTPEEYKEKTIEELLTLLKKENGHLVTGFMGTPYFTHVLSQNHHLKEAYELLLKEDFPSWLYQVKKGATTVWEHWDGIKPDGSMWSPDMNSFNHYAYGAVGEWMYRVIAGIEINEEEPGYKKIVFYPRPGGELTYANGSYESMYGTVSCRWEKQNGYLSVECQVPENTSAELRLDNVEEVMDPVDSSYTLNQDFFRAKLGSGKHEYRVRLL